MEAIEISRDNLEKHALLLEKCFPGSHLTNEYLDWLYYLNPNGNVVGFDFIEGTKIVAHYACIPINIGNKSGLLSINTATHPDFRTKGLYQTLAKLTYEKCLTDFSFVVGVANSNSANTFVDRLGFTEIGRLNLRFGYIRPPNNNTRVWSESEIEWRINSPRQKISISTIQENLYQLAVKPHRLPFKIKALISLNPPTSAPSECHLNSRVLGFTVDWNKGHVPRLKLPERLKPSPLVLILKSLDGSVIELDSWSFPSFDAF